MKQNERTEELQKMLQDVIEKMQDEKFDTKDKVLFAEMATKIIARIYDLIRAL